MEEATTSSTNKTNQQQPHRHSATLTIVLLAICIGLSLVTLYFYYSTKVKVIQLKANNVSMKLHDENKFDKYESEFSDVINEHNKQQAVGQQ